MKENMKAEYKELLIKDLSARVPYGVKAFVKNWSWLDMKSLESVCVVKYVFPDLNNVYTTSESGSVHVILGHDDYDIKPYLFPMSSMTEEQFEELKAFAGLTYEGNTLELVEWDSTCDKTLEFWLEEIPSYCVIKVFDWLNARHFDYRGLIDKDLAIDATGMNIY